MELSAQQIACFQEQGYLIFPGLFQEDEVALMREPLPNILTRRGIVTYHEPEDEVPRIVFALHESDEVFRRLSQHPKLLRPTQALLGTDVHVLQSRVNVKKGFSTAQWNWHQDFNQWSLKDRLQKPEAMLVGVFLDVLTPCNGPLMVIEGSHHFGHCPIPIQKVGLDPVLVTEMAARGQVKALMGPPGTVVFLHPLTVHGSCPNMTPKSRNIFYCAYNALTNAPVESPRHASRCGKDFRPLQLLNDDCLTAIEV